MKEKAAQKEKRVKPGLFNRALAFISSVYRSLTIQRMDVTGIGIQHGTNFNVFFQFSYEVARKYNLGTLEVEAMNRYNLKKCTILDLSESREISFTFSPITGKQEPLVEKIDKVQYLQLM